MKNAVSSGKTKRKSKEITITYVNELEFGLFEKTLAKIYSKKINSGSLEIELHKDTLKTAV